MNIKSVSNNINVQPKAENVKLKAAAGEEKKDQLKISEKAIELNKKTALNPRIEELQDKIKNKFYDSEEIIRQVSSAILKEIKPGN